MHRKIAAFALLFLPYLIPAHAQTPKSLLWEISGNGLQSPSYLYGTMHVGDKRAYKFSKAVMPSFAAASSFAMELDPSEADPLAMMEMMKIDSGKLRDIFTDDEWARLDAFMQEKLKTPLINFNDFGPFFVYSLVAQATFKNQKGQPLDLYFYKEAKKAHKPVHGLETVEEQISAINKMSLQDQKKMLMEAIDAEDGDAEMDKMLKYYSKGDLDMLLKLSDDAEYGAEFENALVVDRNHLMVERLEPLIRDKSTFVAVGALHLPGEEGILKLLAEEGYTVKPL